MQREQGKVQVYDLGITTCAGKELTLLLLHVRVEVDFFGRLRQPGGSDLGLHRHVTAGGGSAMRLVALPSLHDQDDTVWGRLSMSGVPPRPSWC